MMAGCLLVIHYYCTARKVSRHSEQCSHGSTVKLVSTPDRGSAAAGASSNQFSFGIWPAVAIPGTIDGAGEQYWKPIKYMSLIDKLACAQACS